MRGKTRERTGGPDPMDRHAADQVEGEQPREREPHEHDSMLAKPDEAWALSGWQERAALASARGVQTDRGEDSDGAEHVRHGEGPREQGHVAPGDG